MPTFSIERTGQPDLADRRKLRSRRPMCHGEWTSPTQPIPSKPPGFDVQGLKESDLIDFTPELRRQAIEALKNSRIALWSDLHSGLRWPDAADGTSGTILVPGAGGGANWWGGSADPETGFVYMSSATNPSVIALVQNLPPRRHLHPGPSAVRLSSVAEAAQFPTIRAVPARTVDLPVPGLRLIKPPYGRITAYDMNKGTIAWQIANGDTPANVKSHPALQGLNIPKTGSPRNVGIMVTKTLLFAGDGTDPHA